MRNIRLAKLYDKAGFADYAERARTCATWVQFLADGEGERQLHGANFCQLRLCPMCIGRRARRAAWKLSQVLDVVEAEHGCKYIFLTLTMQNVPAKGLKDGLRELIRAWDRLMDQKQIGRSVKGWFRAVEITRNGEKKTYHPHLHAILAVEPRYFAANSPLYITHEEWVTRWQKALRAAYKPSVRVQVAKGKSSPEETRLEYQATAAASKEAAKYCVKDEDYIDDSLTDRQAANIVRTYTDALHRRRLTAFGGWLKEAARKLDADDLDNGDLVHADETRMRDDVAALVEEYRWLFGVGDYILTDRRTNPLRKTEN